MKKLIAINLILIMLFIVLPDKPMNIPINEVINNTIEELIDNNIQEQTNESNELIEPIENTNISRSLDEPRQTIQVANTYSNNCINFIKQFEGCKLTAYKMPGEQYFTIGYGHYGADVYEGQTISQKTANKLLEDELQKCLKYVLKLNLQLNQNQLDALISFTYNCGQGNLKKLTKNRTLSEIAEHITSYTGSASSSNKKGLQKRRLAEKELFLKEVM